MLVLLLEAQLVLVLLLGTHLVVLVLLLGAQLVLVLLLKIEQNYIIASSFLFLERDQLDFHSHMLKLSA